MTPVKSPFPYSGREAFLCQEPEKVGSLKSMKNLILGLGRSGHSARRYLLKTGTPPEDILTYDQKDPTADFKDESAARSLTKGDRLVVSPGIPLTTSWIQDLLKKGVILTSEIGLACESLATEKIVGITGSVGKSTTTALLGAGAEKAFGNVFVGANFGIPFCEYMNAVLDGRRARVPWVVLELSSFQLENCDPLKLDGAIVTSLTANHLERYDGLHQYYDVKWSIIERTRGPVVLNRRGGDLHHFAQARVGQWYWTDGQDSRLQSLNLQQSLLLGQHNQDNLAMAATLSRLLNWPMAAIEGMKSFSGLPHRLENLNSYRGVSFINDSKATAMESVLIAVESALPLVQKGKSIFHFIGGKDKNLPWQELSSLSRLPSHVPIFFGSVADKAKTSSGLKGPVFARLGPAIDEVFRQVQPGDVVLLSPGGTSLDEFKNFEERGDFFRKRVQEFAIQP